MKEQLFKLLREYERYREQNGGEFNLKDFYEWLKEENLGK